MTRTPRIGLLLAAIAVSATGAASAEGPAGVAVVSEDAEVRAVPVASGALTARLSVPAVVIRDTSFNRAPTQGRQRPGRVRQRGARTGGRLSRPARRMLLHAAIGAGVGFGVGSFAGWAVCSNERHGCPVMTRYSAVGGLVGLGLGMANGAR